MIDDMMNIIRGKILKDRDNDSAIGDCCHVGDAPMRIILADNRYFVPSAKTTMFE